MRPARAKVAVWAALGVLAVGAWRLAGHSAPADDPSLVLDRAWFDKKADKYTDYVQAFYASRYAKTAVFRKASAYDIHLELATFRRDEQKLVFAFPQTGRTAETTFTVRACNELPPFDLCLDLSENPWGGPRRYYGMKDQDEDDSALGQASRALRVDASR